MGTAEVLDDKHGKLKMNSWGRTFFNNILEIHHVLQIRSLYLVRSARELRNFSSQLVHDKWVSYEKEAM